MEGLDIRKLYGSHENEIFTIERAFGKKTQVIDCFFWTSTQQSIHVFTPMGRELVFRWRDYCISWAVKDIKDSAYSFDGWVRDFMAVNGIPLSKFGGARGYGEALSFMEEFLEKSGTAVPFPPSTIAARMEEIARDARLSR